MKKFLFTLICFFFSCAMVFSQKSSSGEKEKQFVSDYLQIMVGRTTSNKDLMAYIDPSYFKKNKLKKKDFTINSYTPVDFSIENYNTETKLVDAKIWGKDRSWVHSIHFKVVETKGKLYFIPGRHSKDYIDPWYSVEDYIKE